MFPYIALFLLAICFAWILPSKQGKWLLFFLMLFMSMFRGMNVGGDDTLAYYHNTLEHEFSIDSFVSYDLEFLFVWWTNFIRDNNMNPRWCLYSLSIIQFVFILLSAKRFKVGLEKVLFFFLFLNYYFLSLEISRQIAANAILLYGYSFLLEEGKKKYWFFPIVVLAASLHLSSILALPLFLCRYFKLPDLKRVAYLGYIVIATLFFLVYSYGHYITDFLLSHVDFLTFYQHLGEETTDSTGTSFIGFTVGLLKVEFDYFLLTKLIKTDNTVITNIFLIFMLLTFFLLPITGNIKRVIIIPGIIQIIAYSKFVDFQFLPKRYRQTFLIILTVFWGTICLRDVAAGNYFLVPYYMELPL